MEGRSIASYIFCFKDKMQWVTHDPSICSKSNLQRFVNVPVHILEMHHLPPKQIFLIPIDVSKASVIDRVIQSLFQRKS